MIILLSLLFIFSQNDRVAPGLGDTLATVEAAFVLSQTAIGEPTCASEGRFQSHPSIFPLLYRFPKSVPGLQHCN